MSGGNEHEDREHVIDGESSWEDALKNLDVEDETAKSRPSQDHTEGERGPGRDVAEKGLPGREADGDHDEHVTDVTEETDGESGDDGSGGENEDGVAAEPEEEAQEEVRNKKVQKRTKEKSKELIEAGEDTEGELARAHEELEDVKQQLAIKEDKLVRMVAEFENYKKRTRREWELHQKRANAELIKDILGILDDFERAFEAPDESGEHFRSGVRLIHSGLLDVMGRAGLVEIAAENQQFDPQFHEALGEMSSDDVEEGYVMQVVQKGYMHRDQLLRPAKVIVAKAKEPER